ncbi:polysaccharide deacetylase family protein [Pelagibacterium lentulum]|uniref:Chitooligosaccharide deacetylase n=1 Tax=Pelagibacterium lentulum TaxID=2029865 RepID=A0A916VZE1_9HYPH|nr:polysaccharide deacetylase family protein [Pelagibacterium lentulum]GGA55252.1 polysaccharide deacetylase [Pelagibacterium lentulum]
MRDYIGYADTPPQFDWPGGARVAVNFVVNYEEGSEYSIDDGDGRSESALIEVSTPRVPVGSRDLASQSMYEYGCRVGFWRLHDLFVSRGLPVTIFAAAVALERNPRAARAIARTDWDIVCHGLRWIEHYHLDEAEERDQIARAYSLVTDLLGRTPSGWYCRYSRSENTRRLVVEHGGFAFDSDAYNDELPYWTLVSDAPHLVVPYSLVTNDAKFLQGGWVTGAEYGTFLIETLTGLLEHDGPRMMSVGLHPRIIGHPGRLAGLVAFLDHIAALQGVWVAGRLAIAEHFKRCVPFSRETAGEFT